MRHRLLTIVAPAILMLGAAACDPQPEVAGPPSQYQEPADGLERAPTGETGRSGSYTRDQAYALIEERGFNAPRDMNRSPEGVWYGIVDVAGHETRVGVRENGEVFVDEGWAREDDAPAARPDAP
jgi:hypothetical protein